MTRTDCLAADLHHRDVPWPAIVPPITTADLVTLALRARTEAYHCVRCAERTHEHWPHIAGRYYGLAHDAYDRSEDLAAEVRRALGGQRA